jgi:hypothetical protein
MTAPRSTQTLCLKPSPDGYPCEQPIGHDPDKHRVERAGFVRRWSDNPNGTTTLREL